MYSAQTALSVSTGGASEGKTSSGTKQDELLESGDVVLG